MLLTLLLPSFLRRSWTSNTASHDFSHSLAPWPIQLATQKSQEKHSHWKTSLGSDCKPWMTAPLPAPSPPWALLIFLIWFLGQLACIVGVSSSHGTLSLWLSYPIGHTQRRTAFFIVLAFFILFFFSLHICPDKTIQETIIYTGKEFHVSKLETEKNLFKSCHSFLNKLTIANDQCNSIF